MQLAINTYNQIPTKLISSSTENDVEVNFVNLDEIRLQVDPRIIHLLEHIDIVEESRTLIKKGDVMTWKDFLEEND